MQVLSRLHICCQGRVPGPAQAAGGQGALSRLLSVGHDEPSATSGAANKDNACSQGLRAWEGRRVCVVSCGGAGGERAEDTVGARSHLWCGQRA